MKNKKYNQLTQEQRYHISGLRKTGMSLRSIGYELGVHFSTISRELNRNSVSGNYVAVEAQCLSDCRRRTSLKADKRSHQTDAIIRTGLMLGWSPETISFRMKLEKATDQQLCHSTIYRRIEEDRDQHGSLYTKLPMHGKTRWKGGKRNRNAGAKLIPNRVDISQRPSEVDQRLRIGDWEGDTVHGINAHLVTLVDRYSRFTLVKRVARRTKEEVSNAMITLFSKVHTALTVTLDNGGEFADHESVSKATGVKVYFAKPHASWQRGTNENTNGRIRRFWPKKFDFATLKKEQIDDEILLLNLTPRKVLRGLTPLEVFTGRSVALIA